MSALSSASTTVGRYELDRSDDVDIRPHRPDLHAAVLEMEPDAAATLAADGLPDDRDGCRPQRIAAGQDVAFSHLDGAGCDELAEHARAYRQFGDDVARVRTQPGEAHVEHRDRGTCSL